MRPRTTRPSWLDDAHQAAVAAGAEPEVARARVIAGVTLAVARDLGVRLPPLPLLEAWGPPAAVALPAGQASPGLPGRAHELLLAPAARRRGGAFYTPPAVAAVVAGWALADAGPGAVVADPAVGGAAFLLAAGEILEQASGRPRAALVEQLVGVDIDPVAAAIAEAALTLWAGGRSRPRVVTGDALLLDDDDWPARPDVVVGNPPFLGQLRRATVRPVADARRLRQRFGPAVAAYADTAALFLVGAVRLVAPGGRVALLLPASVLAARDAAPARAAVLAKGMPERVWVPGEDLFEAGARVCAMVVRRHVVAPAAVPTVVQRATGVPPVAVTPVALGRDELRAAPTWSHLMAGAAGVPDVDLDPAGGTLGSLADVTAGFRDEYYGLAGCVVDDEAGELDDDRYPRLVTAGLLDPGACHWGSRPARYLRRRWMAPRVDLAGLEPGSRLGRWVRRRLVPKVVVAPQARVVEAAVDEAGCWVPSTPVVAVAAPASRLWHVAAVLLAPPVSAWSVRRWAGTGLGHDTVRLGPAPLRSVPLPTDAAAWDGAAAAVRAATHAPHGPARRAALLAAGAAACRAYGAGDDVLAWWAARLPGPPPAPAVAAPGHL